MLIFLRARGTSFSALTAICPREATGGLRIWSADMRLSPLPSFPRKRESRGERRVLGRWIPASAGMTEERKAAVPPNAIALPSGRRGRRDGMTNGASRVAPRAGKPCLVGFRVSSAAYPLEGGGRLGIGRNNSDSNESPKPRQNNILPKRVLKLN